MSQYEPWLPVIRDRGEVVFAFDRAIEKCDNQKETP